MKIYVETSVILIALFGDSSEREKSRYPFVQELFEWINTKRVNAIISLYVLQEIYAFCLQICTGLEIEHFAKEVFREVFQNELGIAGLLTREQRLIYGRQFDRLMDASDQPHAISAFLSGCHCIITYDSHFDAIKEQLPVFTPESFLQELNRSK